MSRKRRCRVWINMVVLPFFATLTLAIVSASRSAKCLLIRFRSYLPKLKPSTGTWLHHSSILFRGFFATSSISFGKNSAWTLFLISSPPPFHLFHKLSNQLCGLSFANMRWLALKSIANTQQNRYVCVREC